MRKFAFMLAVLMILTFKVGPLTRARADVVGRLTQVEGQVDLMKGGQLPANTVKLGDGVQPGDVLRTKSLSKAQITFIDNSTLTISPGSRVSIEAYMFDSAQNKRNVVLQLFRGLAHLVVNKIYKSAEPNFVVKTHTAIMGIRGTEVGIRLHPNCSEFLNFKGRTCVKSNYPEIQGSVCLEDWQGTRVNDHLPPTIHFAVSVEDRRLFLNQMAVGLISRESGGVGTPIGTLGGAGISGGQPGLDTVLGSQGQANVFSGNLNAPVYMPLLVVQPPPTPLEPPIRPPEPPPPLRTRPPEAPPPLR